MSCGCKKDVNGNCGQSRSTITIPPNALSSPVVCTLPCVAEFSTAVAKFKNQITRNVLTALSSRCQALVPPSVPPVPPGTLVLLSDTAFEQTLATTINLEILGVAVNSVNIALQNVTFQIIGFTSAIVQISAEVVITIVFQGVDDLIHTQTTVVPLVFTVVVPGDFPANSIVQGSLSIVNQLITYDIDPSTLTIDAVSIQIFFAGNIRILAPVV